MAQRKNKDRKKKVNNYKQKIKKMSEQTQQRHLVPFTEYENTADLSLKGANMDAIEGTLVETYQHLQNAQLSFNKLATALQQVVQQNVKEGKINVKYKWSTGEEATEEDVKKHNEFVAKLNEERNKKMEEVQKILNANKTGLVDASGQPIATDQSLEEEEKQEPVEEAK